MYSQKSFLPLAEGFGRSLLIGLARINGQSVGITANDCRHVAGAMTAEGKYLDAHDQISVGLDGLAPKDDMLARCELLRRRAEMHRAKDELDTSIEVLATAAEIARDRKYHLLHKKIALASAEALEELGDFQGAVDQHKIAWQLQDETRVR